MVKDEADSDIGITKAAPNLLNQLDKELDKALEESNGPSERQVTKIKQVLDPFQDNPQLIDSRLAQMVSRLLQSYQQNRQNWVCEVMYTLCKVRGAKVVSRFFPSDASLVEQVLSDLEHKPEAWERRYVLLLWLAILVLAPFEWETTFGANFESRLYSTVIKYLDVAGKERDAAALVIARLCTRADAKHTLLPKFFAYARECDPADNIFRQIGVLQASAVIWRIASPNEIEQYALELQECLAEVNSKSSIMYQKLAAKNIGRIALAQLTLSRDDGEVPESVEGILSDLMKYLGNQESTVRYTASKAVARIVSKLGDDEMRIEVVQAVLAQFEEDIIVVKGKESLDRVSSHVWHGTLLCVAELLRRRLLEESDFERLAQILQKSLCFEQKRLTSAYGANVRDASCYVCWSLFRVYKDVPKPIMVTLFDSLVSLCCFDREVNIRRAASAALQEGIGRQGDPVSLERGLDLIQALDYFHIGRRSRAYLEVSQKVYDLGFRRVVDDILIRVDSWDIEIRRLTAKAIGELSAHNNNMRAQLLAKYDKFDFEIKHGVLLALGELTSIDPAPITDECIKILNEITPLQLQNENEVTNSEAFMHLFAGLFKHYSSLESHQQEQLDDLLQNKVPIAMQITTSDMIVADTCTIAGLLPSESPVIPQWIDSMKRNKHVFTQALGAMHTPVPMQVRDALVDATDFKYDVTTRKHALNGIGAILTKEQGRDNEYNALIAGLDDYTIDARGDVGSWVRSVAIQVCSAVHSTASEQFQHNVLTRLLRLSAEVMDKLRYQAACQLAIIAPEPIASVFKKLPIQSDRQPDVYFDTSLEILPLLASDNDPLKLDCYLRGLVCTSGALHANSLTLVAAQQAFVTKLSACDEQIQTRVLKRLVLLVDIKQFGSKVAVCAMRTVSGILQAGYELPPSCQQPQFLRMLFIRVYNSHINTKAMARIGAAIQVFACLVEYDCKDALKQLVKLCKSPQYPVRTLASEALYQALADQGDEDSLEVLGNVDWEDVASVSDQMDKLSASLGT